MLRTLGLFGLLIFATLPAWAQDRYEVLKSIVNANVGRMHGRGMGRRTIAALRKAVNDSDFPVLEKMLSDPDIVVALTTANVLALHRGKGLPTLKRVINESSDYLLRQVLRDVEIQAEQERLGHASHQVVERYLAALKNDAPDKGQNLLSKYYKRQGPYNPDLLGKELNLQRVIEPTLVTIEASSMGATMTLAFDDISYYQFETQCESVTDIPNSPMKISRIRKLPHLKK